MEKITLKIDGMMCGMCEAHLNEAVRKAFPVKKVAANHTKGTVEILSEAPLPLDKLRDVITATGYTLVDVTSAPYEKQKPRIFGLFSR